MKLGFWDIETLWLSTDPAPDGKPITFAGERRYLMGVAWACTYTPQHGVIHWNERYFRELAHLNQRRLPELYDYLAQLDLVVDFSGTDFDRITYAACYTCEAMRLPHLDLHALLQSKLPKKPDGTTPRMKLDDVAQATLGLHKTGHGGNAPEGFRLGYAGDLDALRKWSGYNEQDVRLLKRLCDFIAEHGYCIHPYQSTVLPVALPWGCPEWQGVTSTREPVHTPATEKQLRYLAQLRPGWRPTPGLTKRQASEMIEAYRKESVRP